jgi:hypothetical protein
MYPPSAHSIYIVKVGPGIKHVRAALGAQHAHCMPNKDVASDAAPSTMAASTRFTRIPGFDDGSEH